MNLFWKKIFGKLTLTSKYEAQQEELRNDYQRYLEIENSVELEKFNALFHVIKSADFKEKKKTFQNRKYKDTEEYRVFKKYNKLYHSGGIKSYYEVLQSSDLQSYLKFKTSPDYENLGNPEKVKQSETLQAYKKFEKSSAYKTYIRFHDSYILKEYEELKKKVSSDEFVKSNEFWANKNRWKTTEEYVQEQRYYELKKNPDIKFYISNDPKRFDSIRSQKLVFSENFNWNTLDKSHWTFGFHYKSPVLLSRHSYVNEQQANNAGNNISVNQGILRISTKAEKTLASAWDPKKGFVQKEFEFTSDVMQSADSFRQQYGIFQAKIRCTGKINHAFWLGADEKLPLVKIFHFDGKKIKVGCFDANGKKENAISGINPKDYYIYTLVWTEKELRWFVNNLEVAHSSIYVPKESMYLAFNSFISESQLPMEGALEVDWVRVYSN